MLQIVIPPKELYDDATSQFFWTKLQVLQLEHSLVSVAKWESKWCKPFLSSENKTREETLDYVRCMTITQNVDPDVYKFISDKEIKIISSYIEAPMTATTFSKDTDHRINREIITAEIVYYWMITLNIPPEYQKWHFNRLITLINVCNIKNNPPKKMKRKALAARNNAINMARRKNLNTPG